MGMTKNLADIRNDFIAAGLTLPEGLTKPHKQDYIIPLQNYHMELLRAEGKLTKGMEWVHKNIYSPQLALSQGYFKTQEQYDAIVNDPNVYVQQKFDGCRCLIFYSPEDGLEFFTRNRSVTDYMFSNYNDQIKGLGREEFKNFFNHSFCLDSEIISINPNFNGRIMTETVLQAIVAILALNKEDSWAAQEEAGFPVRFKCFDILMLNDKSLMDNPQHERDQVLDHVLTQIHNKGIATGLPQLAWFECCERFYGTGDEKRALYQRLISEGAEGLILKNKFATYSPIESRGNGNRWTKMKRTVSDALAQQGLSDVDAFVTGFEPGDPDKGFANLVGSLDFSVYLLPSGEPHVIARVASFTLEERQAMTKIVDGQVTLNPDWYNKVATIQGQNISARERRFQHARLEGWRIDGKQPTDCTLEEEILNNLIF